jgi:hypothetical protein
MPNLEILILMCWKCADSVMEDTDTILAGELLKGSHGCRVVDGKVQGMKFKACKANSEISTYEQAKKLCPLRNK